MNKRKAYNKDSRKRYYSCESMTIEIKEFIYHYKEHFTDEIYHDLVCLYVKAKSIRDNIQEV